MSSSFPMCFKLHNEQLINESVAPNQEETGPGEVQPVSAKPHLANIVLYWIDFCERRIPSLKDRIPVISSCRDNVYKPKAATMDQLKEKICSRQNDPN
jgi:hypothetical protein